MATIHDIHEEIESWLAAAVHDQLSEDERAEFEQHLASCERCRALYEEEQAMSKMIAHTLDRAKPDLGFEQRIVSGFRRNVPDRAGLMALLANVVRLRATQITGVAALMLALVQVGRLITNESSAADGRIAAATAPLRKEAEARERDSRIDAGFRDRITARSATRPSAPPPAPAMMKSDAAGSAISESELKSRAQESIALRKAAAASAAPSADAMQTAPEEAQSLEDSDERSGTTANANTGGVTDNRKLVRNAQVEIEVIKFDDAVQRITAFAAEDRGYIATSSSEREANGKLRGEIVAKVVPENLDGFLLKLRGLGDVKNQTLGTEDVTKQYFDTDSHLKSARVMEQRLIDILKTKSNKVADLLEVEKELGRVRAQIEEMQGSLKYLDAQVQFATVTITLAEKEMNEPAAFLLKRRAQLALFSTEVEKTFADVKAIVDGAKAQVSSSTLDRDSSGEATARLMLLIRPDEADALIDRIKGMGRVQNYSEQTDRIAQGGSGMSDKAKVERDKVELNITISRNEQEPALQTTSLRILTSGVNEKVVRLKENAANAGAEVRSSSFSRNPDGQEFANITLRVPLKNYNALLGSFDQLGKVKDITVSREDRRGTINEETAPADISIQVYSQANIVSDESGIFATIRRTLAQGAAALLWSLRMIGVALAFFAPWALALAALAWIARRVSRARAARRRAREDAAEERV